MKANLSHLPQFLLRRHRESSEHIKYDRTSFILPRGPEYREHVAAGKKKSQRQTFPEASSI